MTTKGFTNVKVIRGGWGAWQSGGHPIVTGSAPSQ